MFETTTFGAYLLQTLLSLVAVSALAVLVLYAVRRLGGPPAKGPLSLVAQLPLGGSRAIYVVRIGTQHLVVGAGEGGLSRLGEVPAAEAAAFTSTASSAPRTSARFADYLARRRTTAVAPTLATPAPAGDRERDVSRDRPSPSAPAPSREES